MGAGSCALRKFPWHAVDHITISQCGAVPTAPLTPLEMRMLINSLQFILKRYYFNREEGLRVLQQREYTAIEHAGLSYPFKYAGITLRYSMEARSKWFAFKVSRRSQKLEDALEKLRR
ncbi:hypothetical protein IL306_007648 [Fusarium sp. DS 682]|nr:hypothetical protein IL306_007648 [Fusarium sp. DS 682]